MIKESKPVSFNIFRIASAYIGTVVGAGFASGQEVLQFFSAYGWYGFVGVLIATSLFFFFGYSVLLFGHRLNAKSHIDVVRYTNGKWFGTAIDVVITIFLFGAFAAMIAGAGAIFEEQFHISTIWGALIMAIISLLTVITGTRGVVNAISTVVPFLLASVLFISIYSLIQNPVSKDEIELTSNISGATPNWFLSTINYVSYNMVIAIAVLAPMGAKTDNRRKLFWGALLGAIGLGVGIAAINLCVLTNISDVLKMEVPMVEIAFKISRILQIVFSIVLFAEVYTTAIGNLYGLVRRIKINMPIIWLIAIFTLIAFLVAQLGFSNMVKYLYPAVGYAGLLFFIGVIYKWFARLKTGK